MNITYRIGCAGWNLPKEFRDPALSYLERYAQLFNCIEINSSFYRRHQPKTYARWANSTPQDFLFSVKAPKTLTHMADRDPATIDGFLAEVRELGDKLGPILLQFPPNAAFERARAEELFGNIRRLFAGEAVCEPRHSTWFKPEASELLRTHAISLVAADPVPTENAPQVLDQQSRYYRLHGSPQIYYSNYPDAFLDRFHEHLARSDEKPWVIFDNTALGAAYSNALALMERVL